MLSASQEVGADEQAASSVTFQSAGVAMVAAAAAAAACVCPARGPFFLHLVVLQNPFCTDRYNVIVGQHQLSGCADNRFLYC